MGEVRIRSTRKQDFRSGNKKVTIISQNAIAGDGTPVVIMGIIPLTMINQMKGIEAIIVDDNDKVYASGNIHFN
jgi:thiamine biosynthesis lipoprotein